MAKLGIVGFGRTGKALLEYAAAQPDISEILIYTDHPVPDPPGPAGSHTTDPHFISGEKDFYRLSTMDQVIISPGVNGRTPRFDRLREKGVPVISELEYAFRLSQAPWVAVTGTNGKSTTTALIHHLLETAGRDSVLCGNIGDPVISRIQDLTPGKIGVVEVSSFQLEETVDFTPYVGLILNITPDHLDRYPSVQRYVEAKLNLGKNQDERDFMILNRDDPVLMSHSDQIGPGQRMYFSWSDLGQEQGIQIGEENLLVRIEGRQERIELSGNPLIGIHNRENTAAAVLAARVLGVDSDQAESGIRSFTGLPHRMQVVGRSGGVVFINDSKATNIDSARKSIRSVKGTLVVILGGRDKKGEFRLLENELATARVKAILVLGEAADKIFHRLDSLREKMIRIRSLKEAVTVGTAKLVPSGGTLLLAPACASFDMFRDFEHRGRVFEAEVNSWIRSVRRGERV